MIPITRKENYLNEIVGWGETAPEKPLTPEEFFFAAILGEAVQTPEPLSRYQIYLAKIAGRNISVPKPLTRLELFLAKACGMDIETPTPITREEIFWSNYSAIVEFEVEGVPPLTYKAIEGTLENYRIYGNTVDGESVGDRTGNLFDGVVEQGSFNKSNGALTNVTNRVRSSSNSFIYLKAGSYTIDASGVTDAVCYVYSTQSTSDYVYSASLIDWVSLPLTFSLNNDYYCLFGFKKSDDSTIIPTDISNIMLNAGSTALPYEPYGYKVPVTVSNGIDTLTTPIYLPEQIRKVGDEAEYIDYGEQKQHRVRKNLLLNTATNRTLKDVTFTVNEDDSVTCNGTASSTVDFRLVGLNSYSLPAGNYCLTGAPPTSSYLTYYLRAWYSSSGSTVGINDSGQGANFTLTDTTILLCAIVIAPQQVLNNVTFYPMIRKADIEDDTYEPYIENTDLDVTLPALPTLTGTNVLSVGTVVQPSKVYVKYKGERQ